MQNFPNPFTSATKIGFRTNASGFVSLKIFDVMGTEIAGLVGETLPPGYHETEFSPANTVSRRALQSGVYLYRLQLNDRVETRKMVFLK